MPDRAAVTVVGAGIAGLACARALQASGIEVRGCEREAQPGGRMASARRPDRLVDIGAAYFTVRDDEFSDQVEDWRRRGLVRPWTDTFAVVDTDHGWSQTSGPMRWTAPGGLCSLVTDLAHGCDVTFDAPVAHVGAGPTIDCAAARAVVLAMPDPQAAALLDPGLSASETVAHREWEPILVLTAVYAHRRWPDLAAAFVNGDDVLALVIDDGDRQGDGAPVLVAHSTPGFAAPRLDDPAGAAADMLAALTRILGPLGQPEHARVDAWPHARPATSHDAPFHLDDAGIGLCGDGWGSPRIETAWRSGTELGRAFAAPSL